VVDGYDEQDFCRRLDEELFPLLDCPPVCGPGAPLHQPVDPGSLAAVRAAEAVDR